MSATIMILMAIIGGLVGTLIAQIQAAKAWKEWARELSDENLEMHKELMKLRRL
ncbi:hypothetical protein GCM10022378_11410 [Salinicoccus jeotgali]|uniref:Uncharacterized protein n=1 Tax=Salinicoccus jeotgali TaxID=381634 RepID=A0ABP7ESX9_9STAP